MIMGKESYPGSISVSAQFSAWIPDRETVARQLVEAGEIPDLIVTSPILRAVETATALKDVFTRTGKAVDLVQRNFLKLGTIFSPCDYGASQGFVLAQDDRKFERILYVTHGPNIDQLSRIFLGEAKRDAGNAELHVIEAESWRNFNQGTCVRTNQFKPA